LGDFNSDLFIANNNKLIETMMLFSLVNIISKPTRITEHSNNLLDPIIISDTMNYIYSDVLKIPSEISDHDASVAFLQWPKSVVGSFKREVWLYDQVDQQKCIDKLEMVDWITLLCQFDDIDDMCNQFTKTFLELARECIPTKTVTVRLGDKPWFTSEIRKEIRIRDRPRKVMLKYHRNSDICKYKKQRNRVNNLRKDCKRKF
jgi:hypothetical protein